MSRTANVPNGNSGTPAGGEIWKVVVEATKVVTGPTLAALCVTKPQQTTT